MTIGHLAGGGSCVDGVFPLYCSSPNKEFALTQLPPILETIATNLSIAAIAVPDIKSLNSIKVKPSRKEIELILWEVLDNAKKFHPQQDPTITVIVFSTAGNVHIQINNNGLVLSPKELMHASTPYYQGEKDFTGEVPGMGLGLSIATSLLGQVGGSFKIYNQAADVSGVTVELIMPLVFRAETSNE